MTDATIRDIRNTAHHLAVTSSPHRRSTILRTPLLTELRAAIHPDAGGTKSGASTGSALIDATAFDLWEDISGQIESLYVTATDQAPTGSHEQILIDWLGQFTAAYENGDIIQAQLDLHHERLQRWATRIEQYLTPAGRSGDIPGAICPVCGQTEALVGWGELETQMPALGWTSRDGTVTVTCRVYGCDTTWTGQDGLELLRRQNAIYNAVFTPEA